MWSELDGLACDSVVRSPLFNAVDAVYRFITEIENDFRVEAVCIFQ